MFISIRSRSQYGGVPTLTAKVRKRQLTIKTLLIGAFRIKVHNQWDVQYIWKHFFKVEECVYLYEKLDLVDSVLSILYAVQSFFLRFIHEPSSCKYKNIFHEHGFYFKLHNHWKTLLIITNKVTKYKSTNDRMEMNYFCWEFKQNTWDSPSSKQLWLWQSILYPLSVRLYLFLDLLRQFQTNLC